MKKIALVSLCFLASCQNQTVQNEDRVTVAYREKATVLKALLVEKAIDWMNFQVFFRAFKKEEILEVWVKSPNNATFVLLKTFPFCINSGTLGPKRKEGDRQIPEGFYEINRFNPKSSFFLSLGLNYPNISDLKLGDKEKVGSDIFIHGGCASVGCISITDDGIKEVYLLANEAKKNGQKTIEVHIFPMKFKEKTWQTFFGEHPEWEKNRQFWQDLKKINAFFEQKKQIPNVGIDEEGRYFLQND
jgi:murein L,D-transpeptidase YafK